jgi:hypothetical protein
MEFIDLVGHPERLDEIAEVRGAPPLRVALRTLNSPRGCTWTAKCDAWPMPPAEIEGVTAALGLADARAGVASYIDVLARESKAYASFDGHERWARALAREMDLVPGSDFAAEFIVRPAWVAGRDGFAITAYVYGFGEDEERAREAWSAALQVVAQALARGPFSA